MKNEPHTSTQSTWPRLLAEQGGITPKSEVGFLQISSAGQKIKIGDTLGREFKLIQCLFSAQNFLSAKYAPVTQTYERLYSAIKTSADATNAKIADTKSVESEMTLIVNNAVSSLKKGPAGNYLTFINVGSMLRMDIAGAAL